MFNSAGRIFEEELTKLINSSGLTISEAYYIVENASLKLKLLLNDMIMQERLNPQDLVEQKTTTLTIPDEFYTEESIPKEDSEKGE